MTSLLCLRNFDIITHQRDASVQQDPHELFCLWRAAVTLMDATSMQWGLTISTNKTKVLVVGKDAAEQSPNAVITIMEEVLEVVSQFKYSGSMFTCDGMLDTEIAHRVANASSAFVRLQKANVWSSKALSLSTKLQFLQKSLS